MSVFVGHVTPVPECVRAEMRGTTWQDDPRCPAFEALAQLHFCHWSLAGATATGELIVARAQADALLSVFQTLYEARFPIARAHRLETYGGCDRRSMDANNSSAFNFRTIIDSDRLSQHALGLAIDLNPIQNPCVRGDLVVPPQGREFLDRSDRRPGMITDGDAVVAAFAAIGWSWGGHWSSLKDYQHFSCSGG